MAVNNRPEGEDKTPTLGETLTDLSAWDSPRDDEDTEGDEEGQNDDENED